MSILLCCRRFFPPLCWLHRHNYQVWAVQLTGECNCKCHVQMWYFSARFETSSSCPYILCAPLGMCKNILDGIGSWIYTIYTYSVRSIWVQDVLIYALQPYRHDCVKKVLHRSTWRWFAFFSTEPTLSDLQWSIVAEAPAFPAADKRQCLE